MADSLHGGGARRPKLFLLIVAGAAYVLASCETAELRGPSLWRLAGLAFGMDVQGVEVQGTVLDRTGSLLAVQDERSRTIFSVFAPQGAVAEAGEGVRVSGKLEHGIIRASEVAVTGGSRWPAPSTPVQKPGRIEHIIVLMQENHSFDNYFGTYPGADGLPEGLLVEGVAPFHLRSVRTDNLSHSRETAVAAVHGGAMDRFVSAERSPQTMGFYDGTDIPNYWNLARHFTLADRFFSSYLGPSLPNHLYLFAAQAGGEQANRSRPPRGGWAFPALTDRLDTAGIPWKCYDGSSPPRPFSAMNPLAGFKTVSGDRDALSRVVANTELFLDLRDGSLPPVSWVLPNAEESEHPMTDVRVGMWYVTAVANALMKSPYWLNSVLVVTWDEYGGFFDHVPPPRVDGDGYGMRVPALIVSPYARQAVIDHTLYDFASILRFIENRFGLEPLAERDRKANDLGSALDLTQAPLEPFLIRGP